MIIEPVFALSVAHPYYPGERCTDCSIEPTPTTAARMRGVGLTGKQIGDRFIVFLRLADDRTPFLRVSGPLLLKFHLVPLNPAFALFTELEEGNARGGRSFSNDELAGSGELKLCLREEAPVLPAGVFAGIDIALDLPAITPLPETPLSFTIRLKAREAFWAYYLFTTLKDPLKKFAVADASPGGGTAVAFSDDNRRDLSTNPDAVDHVSSDLGKRFPRYRLLRFVSAVPITCRQRPARQIKLSVGSKTLFSSLPTPQPGSFGAVSVRNQREKSQFAIVFHTSA